jgi:hypothetical protein
MSDAEMKCTEAREQFALLLYGELTFDEEETVESHLDHCAPCRSALERQKALHAAISVVEVTPSPALLARCRASFSELLDQQVPAPMVSYSNTIAEEPAPKAGWWHDFTTGLASSFKISFVRPAGAFALLAIGFLAARVLPPMNFGGGTDTVQQMSLANLGGAQVRSVLPQADGRVQIIFDETRQKTVSGTMDDQAVRALLMAAARDASDPGLRAETVTVLLTGANAEDVRETLVFALKNDQNSIVRLKALEGLKGYAHEPNVQGALAQVLLQDSNPGMRTQAIDLLMAREGVQLDRQVIGAMQELMSHENDSYVRQRCQRALQAVKASSEIY